MCKQPNGLCKYKGCTAAATDYATGYSKAGEEYLVHVCLKHAAEMEPRVFAEKWTAAQTSNAVTAN